MQGKLTQRPCNHTKRNTHTDAAGFGRTKAAGAHTHIENRILIRPAGTQGDRRKQQAGIHTGILGGGRGGRQVVVEVAKEDRVEDRLLRRGEELHERGLVE